MGTLESGSPQSKTKGAPTAPEKHVGPAEVAGVDAVEGSEPIHIVIDPDNVDESITSINALLHDMRLERAEVGVDEIPHQEVVGARLIKLLSQYKELGSDGEKKEKRQKKILLKQIEAAAEAFSTQGEIASEAEERFNDEEMPEPKGPGSGAPGKNGAPKKRLEDLKKVLAAADKATEGETPTEQQEGHVKESEAPAASDKKGEEPQVAEGPEGKKGGKSPKVTKKKGGSPKLEKESKEKDAPDGAALLEKSFALKDASSMEATLEHLDRELDADEQGQRTAGKNVYTPKGETAYALRTKLMRYDELSRSTRPADVRERERLEVDIERTRGEYAQLREKIARREELGVSTRPADVRERERLGGEIEKLGENYKLFNDNIEARRAAATPPPPKPVERADATPDLPGSTADFEKSGFQAPAGKASAETAAVVEPAPSGKSKKTGAPKASEPAATKEKKKPVRKTPAKKQEEDREVRSSRKASQKNRQGEGSTSVQTGDHSTVSVDNSNRSKRSFDGGRIVNVEGSNNNTNVDQSIHLGGVPLNLSVHVPDNLTQGKVVQATPTLAPNSGIAPVPGLSTTISNPGNMGVQATTPVAPAPTTPGAPGAPAARAAGAPSATPAAPITPATSAPAAPAAAPGASPEDHIEAYKRWMLAGSPASGAPAVALTPAAAKKFEKFLKDPAELAEIHSLADTLAAAHAKEATFNTPMRRVFGWMSGSHRTGKKEAIKQRADAYDAWVSKLSAHTNRIYAQAEKLSKRSPERLTRYRGLIARKLVQSQMAYLEAKKTELLPSKERGLIRKGLDAYRKIPSSVRVGTSTLLVAGAVAATGGFGGVAAGVAYGAWSFTRGMAGIYVGAKTASAVSRATELVLRSKQLKADETYRDLAYRQAADTAKKSGHGKQMDAGELLKFYIEAVKKERNRKIAAGVAGAAAGMSTGAGFSAALHGLDPLFDFGARSGTTAVIEPEHMSEEARAVARQSSHVPTEEPGSLTPRPSSPETRGPVDERDLENPAQRNGTSKGPVAPAEKSAPGKGAAPEPPATRAPEFRKIPPDQLGPRPEPLKPAPSAPETKNTPAPGPTRTYPENAGKPGVPPVEPSKPSVPDSASPILEAPIQVKSGDTVWGLNENRLSSDQRFAALDRAQKNFVLASLEKQLRALSADELQARGFSSPNIDKIFPGQKLNLSIDATLYEKYTEQAGHLTQAERINILRSSGMSLADATKTLEAHRVSSPMPAGQPAAPTPTPSTPAEAPPAPPTPSQPSAPTQPPASEAPAAPSYTPISSREGAALIENNQEPASIDADRDNELEVERERAGKELAEKIRADERQALIDQGTKLTEGEEAREEAARIARTPETMPPEALDPEHMAEISPRTVPPETLDPEHMAELSPRTRPGGAFNPDARHDSSIYTGPGYDPRMEGAGSLKTPEPIVVQGGAPQDYSAYTGEKPPFNAEAYGGVTEAQFNSLVRTQTMDTITEYFGTRGIFVQNSGLGRFDAAIAWREARGFIEAVKSDPESMAESANVDTKKLSAFVEYLERGAANYNLSTKTSVSSLLEEITKRGVENSVSRTNLP